MEDVARKVGVSKSTVSLVLNDKPGVSVEMKKTVLQAAAELGYSLPERRPLRRPQDRQKNFTVVHLVGQEPHTDIHGPFLRYLQGIRDFTLHTNVNLTAIGGYRKGDLAKMEAQILDESLDGLILMGAGVHRESRLLRRAIELQIPLVVLARNWPDLPISTVGQNHVQQAQIALNHLADLGHRKIAFLANEADQEYEWFDIRLECYQAKMREINGEEDEGFVVVGRDCADAARQLLAQSPEVTAIFAIYDGRAVETIKGLVEMGIKIPEDVSIIGLDNAEDVPVGYPGLTTVGVPHVETGYLAAELLMKQIENNSLSHANFTVFSRLIERDSCGNPAGNPAES
jgi:LacI family transcriptional regulator